MILNSRITATLLLFITSGLVVGCMSAHNIRPLDSSLAAARSITIMTYNIRTGAGGDSLSRSLYELKDERQFDLNPIIEAIRSVDPDVVGLQEVLGGFQTARLSEALNMNYAYVPHGIGRFGVWWGVAILSKFPIQEIFRQKISSGYSNTRANLIANINIFGKKVVFFCVHKDPHQSEGGALRITMERINKIREPVVLMGDLNMLPRDPRHDILSVRLRDSAMMPNIESESLPGRLATYPSMESSAKRKRIDYILVDKERFDVLGSGLINEKYWSASDHLGYYTKVILKSVLQAQSIPQKISR